MTWNFASIQEAVNAGRHYGYKFGDGNSSDFKEFVEKRDARIKVLNGAYESNWAKEGIDLIQGTATFISAHEMEVKPKDGSEPFRITAPHITIATGGFPIKPEGIKGSEHGITSDEYFLIKHLPKKMVFVGAGYIAVELAGVMHAIGVETHLFIRHDTFLRKFDPMIQDTLTKHYEEMGVHVHKNHPGIKEVQLLKEGADPSDPREKELKLIMNDGTEMVTNELLWAIGRSPETRDLGLDNINIKRNDIGHVVVDKYQNSSVEGVYALGDVTGQVCI
jgi:glutathione reductase (NADPH)